MPKHARDDDAADIGAQPYKKGPALEESHQSFTPPPRRDKDRADDPEPPAPRGRVSGGGELGEGLGNDGDQDSQVRRQYIEWTLEDIDDKTIHVRYCSGALDSPPGRSHELPGAAQLGLLAGGQAPMPLRTVPLPCVRLRRVGTRAFPRAL
jgi:hypothetical protein